MVMHEIGVSLIFAANSANKLSIRSVDYINSRSLSCKKYMEEWCVPRVALTG